MDSGIVKIGSPVLRTLHWMNRNTKSGSRKNIEAHYDLGNDFFKLFLDPTMTYSSGYFPSRQSSMEEASQEKINVICRKLKLSPEDHVLEIGSGWGAFAIRAATDFGCNVTTTTISEEQFDYVSKLVERQNLGSKITVLKQDYRELQGQFDKIVSIEMIEAVGLDYLPVFFQVCSERLKQNGLMLLQSITIADERYKQAARSVDFIQRYIFPGGALPSISVLTELSGQKDFRVFDLEDITSHYAETLYRWRQTFEQNLGEIRSLGCSETFIRMWRYYLCYCEGGFRERAIGCVHMMFHKPAFRETLS